MVRDGNSINIDLGETLKKYLRDLPTKESYFHTLRSLEEKMTLASLYEQAHRLGVLNQRCYALADGEWVEVPWWDK